MRLGLSLLLIMILTSACERDIKAPKPDILLTENQMVALITDVQLMEAALNHRRNLGQSVNDVKNPWYNQLFEEHQITEKIFKENMSYYNEQPVVMEQILEKVLADFIQKKTELETPDKESTQE